MSFAVPLMMQSLLNVPLAVHENVGQLLASAATNRLNVHAIARGRGELAEVDGRAALAALRGGSPTMTSGYRPYDLTESGIAIIRVTGMLVRAADIWDMIFGGVTSYDWLMELIAFAQTDQQCQGIFLVINCWGGVVDGLFDLSDFIFAMSERNGGKPIFGMAADFAYSAAYVLLAACDKCFVPETGGVGSIAILDVSFDYTQEMQIAGVAANIFRSLPRKAIGINGLESLDDEAKAWRQAKVDQVGAVLTRKVASYMPSLTQSAISEMQGLDYTGFAAKAIGLVTDVSSELGALAKLERRVAR